MSIAGEQFLNYTNLSNIPPINTTRSEIMSISGTYYIKMWIPNPSLVHGPDFQGGPPAGGPPVGDPTAGAPGGADANNASNEAAPNTIPAMNFSRLDSKLDRAAGRFGRKLMRRVSLKVSFLLETGRVFRILCTERSAIERMNFHVQQTFL